MKTKLLVPIAVMGFALAGAGAAVASTTTTQGCSFTAGAPDNDNDSYMGRTTDCTNTIKVNGWVKEDRGSFPDSTVGSKTNWSAGLAWVYGGCGNGVGQYYGEVKAVSSSGGSQSSRVVRCD